MKILGNRQIEQIIDRLAYQILENNHDEKQVIFLGINNNGFRFAQFLSDKYDTISDQGTIIGRITLDAAKPISDDILIKSDIKSFNKKTIIIVDDVANTGRTIFYGTRPLMEFLPKKVEVAVLVDRKHKTFPIKVDYVGLSLATTLKENIRVDLGRKTQKSVHLE